MGLGVTNRDVCRDSLLPTGKAARFVSLTKEQLEDFQQGISNIPDLDFRKLIGGMWKID